MTTTELIANQPSGLRGWLAFMGIGITLAPVRALVDWAGAVNDPAFAQMWKSGVPLAQNIVFMTHGLSGLSLAGSVWLAFLFFGKDRRFPSHYTAFQLGTVAALVMFAAWITFATGTNVFPTLAGEIGPLGAASLIWIAYLHRSVRVANTFVK